MTPRARGLGLVKHIPESFKELPIPRVHVGVQLLKAGAQHFFCFADFSQSNLKHGHKQAAHYNSNNNSSNSNPSISPKIPHASPKKSLTRSNSCSLFPLRSCPPSLALSFSPYMPSSGSSRLHPAAECASEDSGAGGRVGLLWYREIGIEKMTNVNTSGLFATQE